MSKRKEASKTTKSVDKATADFRALAKIGEDVQGFAKAWINGTNSVHTTLFVRNHRQLEFPGATAEDLKSLYETAEVASFGHGTKTLTDTTVRNGRTLTTQNFALNWTPDRALLQNIQHAITSDGNDDDDGEFVIRAELYRVNLYGPGDFFKKHKDTPRSGTGHFGSLVYCLPTEYEGGTFVICSPEGAEYKYDWSSAGAETASKPKANSKKAKTEKVAEPIVNFIAFASDLDHWIEPVTSGYRVTVTFHLFKEPVVVDTHFELRDEHATAVASLVKLKKSKELADKRVIFVLNHKYSASPRQIVLKGGDVALFGVLKHAGMDPQLLYYYTAGDLDNYGYDDDRIADFFEDSEPEECYLIQSSDEDEEPFKLVDAFFSTEPQVGGEDDEDYYGNEGGGEEVYGDACIVVDW